MTVRKLIIATALAALALGIAYRNAHGAPGAGPSPWAGPAAFAATRA